MSLWLAKGRRFVVVGEASEGAGLVALARTSRPDLVLLPYALNGSTAHELSREIRQFCPAAAIIVYDDYGAAGTALPPRIPDVATWLPASISPQELPDWIERALSRRSEST